MATSANESAWPRRGVSIVPDGGLMLLVGAAMIAVILYSARTMDENIVSSQTELIDNSINARLDPLAARGAQRRLVGRSGGQEPRRDVRSGLARPRGRRLHDPELPPRPDHDPRRAATARSTASPARAASTPRALRARSRRGAAAGRGRCAAAPTSRRGSPKPPSDGAIESEFSDRRYGRSAAAVVQVGDHGELASVMAITPSVDMSLQSPTPRILVSFIKLDGAYWQAAGRDMLLPDLGFGRPSGERRGQLRAQDRQRPARSAR